jgi:nucleotide-binding universal stress UspA family protein
LEMVPPPESGAAAVAVVTWPADLQEAAAKRGQQFVATLRDEGIDGTWVAKHGPARLQIARLARMTDLVVLGQRDPDHLTALTTPEDVVLACGRPVLMVPYAGRFDDVGKNAIIAWNGSRESARAAHDGLPLLGTAKNVLVLSINPEPDQEELRDGLVRNLIHHGLHASSETDVVKGSSPAEVVLPHVANIGGDLVVMGAYGRSRLRETILGA